MRERSWLIVVGMFLLSLVASLAIWKSFKRGAVRPGVRNAPGAQNARAMLPGANGVNHEAPKAGQQQPDSPSSSDDVDGSQTATSQSLSQWIKEESASVERLGAPDSESLKRLKDRAMKMTAQEKRAARIRALNMDAPLKERLLAVEMLSQGGFSDELLALATSPVPSVGPIEAHSETEIRKMRELALRAMALQNLSDEDLASASEALANDSLKEVARNIRNRSRN